MLSPHPYQIENTIIFPIAKIPSYIEKRVWCREKYNRKTFQKNLSQKNFSKNIPFEKTNIPFIFSSSFPYQIVNRINFPIAKMPSYVEKRASCQGKYNREIFQRKFSKNILFEKKYSLHFGLPTLPN